MSTVRDMIRKKGEEIFSIEPEANAYEALALMAKYNLGALLVMTGNRVEGIVSERDFARKLDLEGRAARETKVGEIMTTRLISIEAGQPLEECMSLMIENNIRHLPVYEGRELLGLISIRDVLKEVVDAQKSMISQLQGYITGGS